MINSQISTLEFNIAKRKEYSFEGYRMNTLSF